MSAPHLNRRLRLEELLRVADGLGGHVEAWSLLGTLWGAIEPGAGRGAAGEEVPLSRVPCRITLRAAPVGAPSRPKPGQRLREGLRSYAVLAVAEREGSGRYLTCFAQEEGPG